ncbi:hypothetical protein [Methanofollis fontis]|uniref:Transglutaminase-like domain-containing protein n=1 Tax=Methanofollis fontis TaxID=2052832 RepID=A0A483CZE6_9EURY|nr:hypothetical protein [Methanofollis fontis]TAJ45732.1 hypothetical protein CUJ86_03190 [Methanofollis fontis]
MSATVRPLLWILLLFSLAVIGTVLLSISGLVPVRENVYPGIVVCGESGVRAVTHQFSCHSEDHSVMVPVEMAVYLGAKRSPKEARIYSKMPPEEMMQEYYSAFIFDECQEGLYAEILADLRSIRDASGLDDDGYLELLAVFVQSLPFEGDFNETGVKFPVETVVEGGDCDDRSVLLIGLMAREGYDAALLVFEERSHTAVGVRDGSGVGEYGGYACIETTAVMPVGEKAVELANGDLLDTEPLVIRFGNGTKCYHGQG